MRKVLLLLALAGCRHHHFWFKEDTSPQDRKAALYECQRDATFVQAGRGRHGRSGLDVDEDMLDQCMDARGWTDVLAK